MILFVILLVLFVPEWASAFTTTACIYHETGTCRMTDGSLADVQAALTASSASDGTKYGDGIYIPDTHGSIPTWGSTLSINKVGVLLAGVWSGAASTRGAGDPTLGSLIKCSAICVTQQANYTRVTGITFWGLSAADAFVCLAGAANVRADHLNIIGTAHYGLRTGGIGNSPGCTGVWDHNAIGARGNQDSMAGMFFTGQVSGGGLWLQAVDFGSANWLYVEDNDFNGNTTEDYIEAHWGGKGVLRHNTLTETGMKFDSMMDSHNVGAMDFTSTAGNGGNTGANGRAMVINNNLFVLNSSGGSSARRILYLRGGTGLIYNNVVSYYLSGSAQPTVQIHSYRAQGGVNAVAGNCPFGGAEGFNAFDQPVSMFAANTIAGGCAATTYTRAQVSSHNPTGASVTGEGYPLYDGIGTGPFSCAGPGQTNCTYAGVHEPYYFWNNQWQTGISTFGFWNWSSCSGDLCGDFKISNDVQWAIQNNRDYCVSQTTQPASCGGVSLNYTEYTYPHPLTGSTIRIMNGAIKATGVIKVQ